MAGGQQQAGLDRQPGQSGGSLARTAQSYIKQHAATRDIAVGDVSVLVRSWGEVVEGDGVESGRQARVDDRPSRRPGQRKTKMGRLLLYPVGIGLVVGPRSRVAGAGAGAGAGALGRGLFRLWGPGRPGD